MTDKFIQFILDHSEDDTAKMILSRGKWPDIDVDLAVSCINSRKKIKDKVPSFYAEPSLVYPLELSAEQCSSEETAAYKASLARSVTGPDGIVADLTCGLGVDSAAFASSLKKVWCNEMRENLANAVRDNFRKLKINNATVSCKEITEDNVQETVKESGASLVYMDPARRSSSGSKVFRLEDCSPDVLKLKDKILQCCRYLMLKLSPMADISIVCSQLGEHCREVHITGKGGECKELIVLMDREHPGGCIIRVHDGTADFSFSQEEERNASATYPGEEGLSRYRYLYEPSKSMLKSGAFKLIGERFGLVKIDRSAHLYVSEDLKEFPGKTFSISEVLPMDKRSFKAVREKWPHSEVTARNLHLTSEDLKKKMGVSSGNDAHIFAVGCGRNGNFMLVCQRLPSL